MDKYYSYYSLNELKELAFEYLCTVVNDSTYDAEIIGKATIETVSFLRYIKDTQEEKNQDDDNL